jgi:hypothetical protein
MERNLEQIDQAVEATMENARGPIDNYFDVFQITIGLNPWYGTDLVDKMQHIAKQNIHATFEYISQLTAAKDFKDVVSAQRKYMQSQFSLFSEELKAVGRTYRKIATDQRKASLAD